MIGVVLCCAKREYCSSLHHMNAHMRMDVSSGFGMTCAFGTFIYVATFLTRSTSGMDIALEAYTLFERVLELIKNLMDSSSSIVARCE